MTFHLTVSHAIIVQSSSASASVVVYATTSVFNTTTSVVLNASAFGTTCHTGRTAVAAMELTTVPTVVHTHMLPSWSAEVLSVTIVVATIAMYVPGMSTTIGDIEARCSEVEVVTVRITGVDAEVPVACLPIEGTVEIAGCQEGIPLPVHKDITQIEVATLPIDAKHVRATSHTHQIVEVDLITSLVLLVGEVELIGHLISQEQGLSAGLLETHCGGRYCYRQHRYQDHQHLFHNRIFLTVRHSFFNFTVQRNDFFSNETKDFP